MRLHTDHLTETDIHDAAHIAGVDILDLARHGSRSRHHAFDLGITGSGPFRTQYRGYQDYPAATWDEWGILLGVLFDRDPRMIAGGPNGYVGEVDYHWQTGSRFIRRPDVEGPNDPGAPRVLSPAEQHRQHRWDGGGRVPSGAYYVSTCRCGAETRRLAHNFTRADLGLDMPTREEVDA